MNDEFQTILQNRAHVIIGKNGITPNMLAHIRELFKSNKMLKIKIMKEVAQEYGIDYFLEYLIKNLGIFVLDVRGFTAVISKKAVKGVRIPKKYKNMKDSISTKSEEAIIENPSNLQLNKDENGENEVSEYLEEEPEFIDYDNEELMAEIDEISDEIYGKVDHSSTSAMESKEKTQGIIRKPPQKQKKKFNVKNSKKKSRNKKGASSSYSRKPAKKGKSRK
ncbi:MAG: hypothetical protein DRO88_11670, partial [Promethearchaeia archaeon]